MDSRQRRAATSKARTPEPGAQDEVSILDAGAPTSDAGDSKDPGDNSKDPGDKKKDHAAEWTPEVVNLLRSWQQRSTVAEHAYYAKAERLRVWNYLLGIPVVIVTGVVGTAVFASLGRSTTVSAQAKVAIGAVTILAAVLAGVQTFTKLGEAAQQNGIAGDWYASIRRDIDQALSLPLALRDSARDVVDGVRKEMNKASQKSPELGERWWGPFAKAYDVDDLRIEDRFIWWLGPPKRVTRRGAKKGDVGPEVSATTHAPEPAASTPPDR